MTAVIMMTAICWLGCQAVLCALYASSWEIGTVIINRWVLVSPFDRWGHWSTGAWVTTNPRSHARKWQSGDWKPTHFNLQSQGLEHKLPYNVYMVHVVELVISLSWWNYKAGWPLWKLEALNFTSSFFSIAPNIQTNKSLKYVLLSHRGWCVKELFSGIGEVVGINMGQ